eukprot:TRINITY_DN13508_c0_g1_i1.p1 TRINITY_DN13508_c0_g1~~TRINITY_DN13508_c0_g1_i1.p1  ORF type:complete len:418 (+),score=73.38 TRINITY_DN13508_c0_g1_i1:39-1256(+)
MEDLAELWDCLETAWDGEVDRPQYRVVSEKTLQDLAPHEEACFERGGLRCLEKVDPVLGPVLPGFLDRSTYACLELERKFQFGGNLGWLGDIEGGAGGWVEGLCHASNTAQNAPSANGIGMGSTMSRLEESPTTRFLPKAFHFTGADTTGDPREPSNIKAFTGAVQQRTRNAGLQVLLGAEPAGSKTRTQRAYTVARLLLALLSVSKGGSFILHVPDIASEFSASILYILRLTFDRVSLTWPRVLPPTKIPSCFAICQNKTDPASFAGQNSSDPLTTYLYKVVAALSGPEGETAVSLVDRISLEEPTFKQWIGTEIGGLLSDRLLLLSGAAEANGKSPSKDSDMDSAAILSQYYNGLVAKNTIPASQFLPQATAAAAAAANFSPQQQGKRGAFNNMTYYPQAKRH